ncbi:MAG: hypothetical protein WDM78_23210 [Puia sp.]
MNSVYFRGAFNSSVFSNTNELKSGNYYPALKDTIHNLQTIYPLVENPMELSGPEPLETISIVIPDYKSVCYETNEDG